MRSTPAVAVCCSRASLSSRASNATSPCAAARERDATFGAVVRFCFATLSRRPLAGSPLLLDRLFIALPIPSRAGIVAGQTGLPKVASSQRIKFSCLTSVGGQNPDIDRCSRDFRLAPDGDLTPSLPDVADVPMSDITAWNDGVICPEPISRKSSGARLFDPCKDRARVLPNHTIRKSRVLARQPPKAVFAKALAQPA